ncbi:Bug family tripartite tricarboxylate transporter substrate binding protein [Pseudomonas profundi]|uniref:Bug family tripartite tricarboxylate transporter substrate binding protein n=1 Tax=Pseudomonas profundi TaxID=1981513 RepID=UPI00123C13BD|nr:tripartite tricarboxylate transporter substrate binding protein [Pseudomonas profundi]
MKVRKVALLLSLIVFGMGGVVGAQAQSFPKKAISLVVVWPAGGSHDIAARMVAENIDKSLGEPVVITNVTGAAGSNGMRHVAQAEPDGYTIGLMGMHALVQSFMNPNAPSLDSFEPLVFMAQEPGSLQVRSDLGINNIEEYVQKLKDSPGSLIHGNDAMGGNTFVYTKLLEEYFDVELTKVPYPGHAANTGALVSGEIESAAMPVSTIAQHHEAGTVKTLGVMAEERSSLLPDVPTFKEQGHNLVSGDYYIFFMPKGVPDEVAQTLESAFLKAIQNPALQQRMEDMGMTSSPGGRDIARQVLAEQEAIIYPILLNGDLVHESLIK